MRDQTCPAEHWCVECDEWSDYEHHAVRPHQTAPIGEDDELAGTPYGIVNSQIKVDIGAYEVAAVSDGIRGPADLQQPTIQLAVTTMMDDRRANRPSIEPRPPSRRPGAGAGRPVGERGRSRALWPSRHCPSGASRVSGR
jgi:hypothetical protein